MELSYRGGCEDTSIHVGVSKTFILSISGPWDLLETIPRAISDRMVRVPSDFVSSRAILGQNKVPRALSTSGVFYMQKSHQGIESGVRDFLHKNPSNFEKKERTPLRFPGDVFGTRTNGTPPYGGIHNGNTDDASVELGRLMGA